MGSRLAQHCTQLGGEAFTELSASLNRFLDSNPKSVSELYATTTTPAESRLSVIPVSPSAYFKGVPVPLPALPPILDPSLAKIPFICKGSLGIEVTQREHANDSYERLEWYGDAYLQIIASRLLYQKYPQSNEGWLTETRSSLVKNETLAVYSLAYGFDERVRVPKDFAEAGAEKTKTWTKVLADVFEAYVAAIVESDKEHGFVTAERWLSILWAPSLPKANAEMLEDPLAKQNLAKKLVSPGAKLEYIEEVMPKQVKIPGKDDFQMGVYLTGWGWTREHLGSGRGPGKGVASVHAAMKALLNPTTAHAAAIKRVRDEKKKQEAQNPAPE